MNAFPLSCVLLLLLRQGELVTGHPHEGHQVLSKYNCSKPGLEDLTPGMYEGVLVNYLSIVTETSSPNFPIRAQEFTDCTGGEIVFAESADVWEDAAHDLGTKTSRGSELYDGYLMSYSLFPEISSLGLAEHLNERIRQDNGRLRWEDVLPQVRTMGEYRKNGVTNVDFLMYDGDFFVPIIRLDLLEKHNLPLPNTWEEVVDYAKFFNGTDLNDDGQADDYGFCHFPRLGAGFWDWLWAEALYSTWATFDQTDGANQGFFFDPQTMEPSLSEGFRQSVSIWKDLWTHGSDGCISSNFVSGRCAIGFAPPGCWKGIFLNPDGVNRKDENGTVVWRPTFKNGVYAEPYRFKPFGSTKILDRSTGKLVSCTPELCPKAEPVPSRGHHGDDDRASVLKASPLEGTLVNRSPFYWSGGLGTLIRKSSPPERKDFMWDFFVYTNSPETSVHDVANYASWLDSWRYSQLTPGDNFIQGGWSEAAYSEHNAVMQWALGRQANGALNLQIPGLLKYTRDVVGGNMQRYIASELTLDGLVDEVNAGWSSITALEGKLDQLEVYRSARGLDALSEVQLCRLHRELMDERDPSVCPKYDPDSSNVILVAVLVPAILLLIVTLAIVYREKKRLASDNLWKIDRADLVFRNPPEALGRGTFGVVLLADYHGTQVAVKRVLPPNEKVEDKEGVGDIEAAKFGSGLVKPKLSSVESSRVTTQWRLSSMVSRNASSRSDTYHRMKEDFVEEMRQISKLRHPCITTIMGAVMGKGEEPMLVMEMMENGSLYDMLHNETFPLDGVRFLHFSTPTTIHGDLKSRNVLVDRRFRAKVADFGLSAKRSSSGGTLQFMAPELLRGETKNTTASDVYAFGIMLYEVFSRKEPYEGEDLVTIKNAVAYKQKRPPVPQGCPPLISQLMTDCIGEDPDLRPAFDEIDVRLRRLDTDTADPGETNLALAKREKQHKVARSQNVLFDVFPRHIAEALRDGRTVEPEKKDCVTIFFSDIVGFTNIATTLSPEEVSDMLNRLYSRFDELTHRHDIHKMETIGDAYMCASNLVKEQPETHVKIMAEFALDAIEAARQTLVSTSNPDLGYITIRVGLHCGPLIAGVVGSRLPKYGVFGDTVNTAARMESNSLAGRIQCTQRVAELLEKQGGPRTVPRGIIDIKGKGRVETFFVKDDTDALDINRTLTETFRDSDEVYA